MTSLLRHKRIQIATGLCILFLSLQGCTLFSPSAQQNTPVQLGSDATPTPAFARSMLTPPLILKPKAIPKVFAIYKSGQTFITWVERTDLHNEIYKVYRSSAPITAENYTQAILLGKVGKDSARFYANRFMVETDQAASTWVWQPRFVDRYVITNLGGQIPQGTGLLVWTLATQDFGGASSGSGYYAVTVTPAGGSETFDESYAFGPVAEAIADPSPVEIHSATNINLSPRAHVFIQYMDLRNWNPTFHAPNPSNNYYGLSPSTDGIANDLQYAYDYVVTLPDPKDCGGSLPANLPVVISLHGHRSNTYWNSAVDPYPESFCAYVILPEDESDTWYFGFAEHHDYRLGGTIAAGDTIVNYTEQRVLRMLYDLERNPLGPAVDPERVYVVGQSMGASGALAFSERYPNVFAAAYASQPMTNFLTAGVTQFDWVALNSVLWGSPSLALPVQISAPNHWADALQKYNGTSVWDWQDYIDNVSGNKLTSHLYDEVAPIGVIFGTQDHIVSWATQGQPTFIDFNLGKRAWGGSVNAQIHQWQYYFGLPPSIGPDPSDMNKYTWIPFWGLTVIKDETAPGLSNLSGDDAATPGGYSNQTILWSSSWDPWDITPVDTAEIWAMSFCSVAKGSTECGSGIDQTVDITPRRLQHFVVTPDAIYHWQNMDIKTNRVIAAGTVKADDHGLLVVPHFAVTATGNRLIITPDNAPN